MFEQKNKVVKHVKKEWVVDQVNQVVLTEE
jgi:hypothetical protein